MFYALANNLMYMQEHVSILLALAPVGKMNHNKSILVKLLTKNVDSL